MNWLKNLSIAVMFIAAFSLQSVARIHNVPDDFGTIELAMNRASSGDTILVAPGMYNYFVEITKQGIVLASRYIFSNDPIDIAETVISNRGNGRSLISMVDKNEQVVEINGFTLRGGVTDYGGGVYCRNSRAVLQNLIIEENRANHYGGGVYSTTDSEVTLRNVLLRNNTCYRSGGGFGGNNTGQTRFEGVQFIGNVAQGDVSGGAVNFRSSMGADFVDCLFEGNLNGLFSLNMTTVGLRECVIRGNAGRNGIGLFHCENSIMNLRRVLIAQSRDVNVIFDMMNSSRLYMDNVTVAENSYEIVSFKRLNQGRITNSIIHVNAEGLPSNVNLGNYVRVSYSNVQGGFDLNGGNWLEGNIDLDPQFKNRQYGDFRLDVNSPCIDSGDPDAELDLDETRIDMGAIPRLTPCLLSGTVRNALNDSPIEGARIRTSEWDITFTDENGEYVINEDFHKAEWIDVYHEEFLDIRITNLMLQIGDTLEMDFEMVAPVVVLSQNEIALEADFGAEIRHVLTIENAGSADYEWSSELVHTGVLAFEPFDLFEELPLGDLMGFSRINGVISIEGCYYVTTSDLQLGNWIYVVTHAGEFVSHFRQPVDDNGFGMIQLAWDGELLWGGYQNTMYGMTLEGEVVESFEVDFSPIHNVAWDERNECFWMSGLLTDIRNYDQTGTYLGKTISRNNRRVYGLAVHPDENIEKPLMILTKLFADAASELFCFDPFGGSAIWELMKNLGNDVHYYGINVTSYLTSDNYQIITIDRADAYNLHRFQLAPRFEWITMETTEGVVGPLSEQEVILNLKAFSSDSMGAVFTAEITIFNDFRGEIVIPVSLEMLDLSIELEPVVSEFGLLEAYPNPFNSVARLNYSLPNATRISLKVYDVSGRLVASLLDEERSAGMHTAIWDAAGFSTGLYFVRAETTSGLKSVQKVMLLK